MGMTRVLLPVFASAVLCAAPALHLVQTAVSDIDGGPPNPVSFEYRPGQVVYFTCRVSGYTQDKVQQVHLAYTVQAFDARGVPVAEISKENLTAEVTAQDKEWLPKIDAAISLPSLLFSGDYKIIAKVEDLVAKTSAELTVPFKVRGHDDVQPSESLAVRAFRFLRNEDDTHPAERAAYRPGDHLWAKFAIVGFRSGPLNKVDVSYVTSVLGPDGKTLWTQPEPEGVQEDSFYPKPYIQAEMGIEIQAKIKPGHYQLMILAKDAIGNQTCEVKQPFTIE
jgi:hypothetical protein